MFALLLSLALPAAHAADPAQVQSATAVVLAQGEALDPAYVSIGETRTRITGKGLIVTPCGTYPYAIASFMTSKDGAVKVIGFTMRIRSGGDVTVTDTDLDGVTDDQLSSDGAPNTVNYQQIYDDGVACTVAAKKK
ncbi:MAG: hypothetical protein AAB839_02385 [Patescibacteria group bacterium]